MAGAVWLHEVQLPSYDYWQFWRNTDDRDVGRFLRLFTDLPLDEVARLERLEGAEINEAKKMLADAATTMCRGAAAAAAAAGLRPCRVLIRARQTHPEIGDRRKIGRAHV